MSFHVGDRVVSLYEDFPGLEEGEYGTVVKVSTDNSLIIKWDKFSKEKHDCWGEVPQGYGWFVSEDFIDLVEEQAEDLGELPENSDIKFLFGN